MSYLDELAARLDVPYRIAPLTDGCRGILIDGAVVLAQEQTPERAHWAYCHEVAHLRLDHPKNPPRDPTEEQQQEAEANALAADLLLPEQSFRRHAHRSLTNLKERFPFASHEALAR
ncbi:MAG TPA: ImmA/IrrE family metallo-endopeptidase, partial [bacterium]